MKIVSVDNFARETVSDTLIAENVPPSYAYEIVNFLNGKYSSDKGSFWAAVRADDYELYTYEP